MSRESFRVYGCVLALAASGCDPTVIVGARLCAQSSPDGVAPDPDAAVGLPWSTGFEDGFCEYTPPLAFCYQAPFAAYQVVTSPVHSGRRAAAFTVRSDLDGGSQTRCVTQGVFPPAAYYGAWYYVPAPATNNSLWNLFHFVSGTSEGGLNQGTWDVSLTSLGDGGLHVSFFDFIGRATPDAGAVPPIPIGQWFHIEVYFKRAKDASGEISVWQDGVLAVRLTNLVTDQGDWGQWYVGNLATALAPAESTIYVDDVSITASP